MDCAPSGALALIWSAAGGKYPSKGRPQPDRIQYPATPFAPEPILWVSNLKVS